MLPIQFGNRLACPDRIPLKLFPQVFRIFNCIGICIGPGRRRVVFIRLYCTNGIQSVSAIPLHCKTGTSVAGVESCPYGSVLEAQHPGTFITSSPCVHYFAYGSAIEIEDPCLRKQGLSRYPSGQLMACTRYSVPLTDRVFPYAS